MFVPTKKKTCECSDQVKNRYIPKVSKYKFLDAMVDEHLNWNFLVPTVKSSVAKVVGIMKR